MVELQAAGKIAERRVADHGKDGHVLVHRSGALEEGILDERIHIFLP